MRYLFSFFLSLVLSLSAAADVYRLNWQHPGNATPDGSILYPMQIKGTILRCGAVSGVYTETIYIPGAAADAVVDVGDSKYCVLVTDEWIQDGTPGPGYSATSLSESSPEFFLFPYSAQQISDCNVIPYSFLPMIFWGENPYLTKACKEITRSSITRAQYDAIAVNINSDPVLAALAARKNYAAFAEIARILNSPTDTIVWRGQIITSQLLEPPFPWKDLNGLTPGRYQIWQQMTSLFTIDTSDVNVRDGVIFAFGRGPNGMLLLSKMKRKATFVEDIFAIGAGTDASPATMTVRGEIFVSDIIRALNLISLPPTATNVAVPPFATPIDSPPTWGNN